MVVSPRRTAVTVPARSTVATSVLLLSRNASALTSRTLPSAVRGEDGHLLLHARQRDDGAFRQHLQALHARTIEIELDALGDPAAEQFVIRLARLRQHAADVGTAAGAFSSIRLASGAARLKRRPLRSSVSER